MHMYVSYPGSNVDSFRNILAQINEFTKTSDKGSTPSKYSINSKNEKGETALLVAAKNGKADFVKALLDYKANPARQGEKTTALGHADPHVICFTF